MNNTLQFDGKSTYVEVPDLASPSNEGAITIEFWNYVKSGDKGQTSFLFAFITDDESSRTSCHAPWSNQLYWDCGNWQNSKDNLSCYL